MAELRALLTHRPGQVPGPAVVPYRGRALQVRIAPRVAVAVNALDSIGPRWVNALMQRRNEQLNP